MRENLEKKYIAIWEKILVPELNDLILKDFTFQYDIDEKNSDLLFLGINPSYKNVVQHNRVYDKTACHPYFDPFKKIKSELEAERFKIKDVKWTHLDLLVFRKTNQKYVDTIIKKFNSIDFIQSQLDIARERIIFIKPKILIVCNTKARELTGYNQHSIKKTSNVEEYGMKLEFEFNFEFGSYRITNVPELNDTHVLFSSMLSGQRALDLGSRERMVWQIGRILKH